MHNLPHYNARAAAAWRVLVPLFRKYQRQADFRLFETHPHNYDCLTLRSPSRPISEIRFHLSDGSIQASAYRQLEAPHKLPKTYIVGVSGAETPASIADQVALAAGWGEPKHVGNRVPALSCMDVINVLMHRYSTGDVALEARSGYFQGEEGGYVREWMANVPWAKERLDESADLKPERQIEIGRRVWRLHETPLASFSPEGWGDDNADPSRTVILNFATGHLMMPINGWNPVDLEDVLRKNTNGLSQLADTIIEVLRRKRTV